MFVRLQCTCCWSTTPIFNLFRFVYLYLEISHDIYRFLWNLQSISKMYNSTVSILRKSSPPGPDWYKDRLQHSAIILFKPIRTGLLNGERGSEWNKTKHFDGFSRLLCSRLFTKTFLLESSIWKKCDLMILFSWLYRELRKILFVFISWFEQCF